MRRIGRAVILVAATSCWTVASAQAPTVSGTLDAMFVFVFQAQSCEVSPTPEQAAAMTDVGGPLQRKANMSNDDMDKAYARATSSLPAPDCSAVKASMQSEVDRLVAMAKQVL